ncbi:Short transient receptor potential channel 5 [Acropora cervicornis]|uniref:Short transient receptor potential channel 5 n=1 Tax=Acropora cervicornis TaxID=6130 RepID=A0AAD9QR82_ACRCE|nr:Short transient receptor potential channel 5 [Acropora cervicornis]
MDLEQVYVKAKEQTVELSEDVEMLAGSLSENEVAFFEAVRSGKKEIVQELINDKHVNVNCKNYNGETALQIAVEKDAIEIMQILLRKGAEIRSALFQAVRNNSLHCVRILVAYDPNVRRGTGPKTLERGTSAKVRRTSSSFDEFLTPLELAVLNGNSEIVKFLVSKGFKVDDPQSCQSFKPQDLDDQNEKETMIRLRDSLVKLNTYRALASPLYIAHKYLHETQERKDLGRKTYSKSINDPLLQSLRFKRKLKKLARNEGEFRDEYISLSAQSENFAVRLLDECRNLEEIATVMEMPELQKTKEDVDFEERLPHPYSQVMLNSVVYRGTHRWNNFSSFRRFFLALLYTLIMPLCMMGYMLTPSNGVTEKLEFPLYKLLSHVSSMIWLLVLVTLSAFEDKFNHNLRVSPLTVLIGIWVAGITVQEIQKVLKHGMDRYLSEWWHLALIPMIAFYIIATVLWIVGYAFAVSNSGDWTVHVRDLVGNAPVGSYNLLLLSNSFYSLALMLTFFEASHFLQVNSTLGPLHLSLMMMVKDIVRFLALFGLNVLAFALAMRRLYSHPVQNSDHTSEETKGTHNHSFQRFVGTLSSLFWALFGHVELEEFENKNAEITEVTGKVIFAGYSLASVLVALNLLIAMLNNSYKKVDDEKDMKWKFSRTRIWMYYVIEVSPLPPPFNLVPVEKISFVIRWLTRRCGLKREKTTQKEGMEEIFATKDTREEEPVEKVSSPDELQTTLEEVTRTLQTLQLAMKQFRKPVAKNEDEKALMAASWSSKDA